MGNPVGPYVRGDDCLLCHAAGTTPKYVRVAFSGTRCDGVWTLTQHPIDPCAWFFQDATYRIALEHSAIKSTLEGVDTLGRFFYDAQTPCQVQFYDAGRNAWGHFWWGTHPAVGGMIGSGYLWSGPNSRYEAQYRGDNKWTFGLRNIRVPANILVQYEP